MSRSPSRPPSAALAAALASALLLGACALPDRPERPAGYDLGPPRPLTAQAQSTGLPLGMDSVQAPAAIDATRLNYRLSYAGAEQQPRPYAHARWLMSPTQLLTQRLREVLAERHPVLDVGTGLAVIELRLELDQFDQVFSSPEASEGVLRLRATAIAPQARQQRLLGQRSFEVRQPAPTPDAEGGVQALRAASDALARQLADWVEQFARTH